MSPQVYDHIWQFVNQFPWCIIVVDKINVWCKETVRCMVDMVNDMMSWDLQFMIKLKLQVKTVY